MAADLSFKTPGKFINLLQTDRCKTDICETDRCKTDRCKTDRYKTDICNTFTMIFFSS